MIFMLGLSMLEPFPETMRKPKPLQPQACPVLEVQLLRPVEDVAPLCRLTYGACLRDVHLGSRLMYTALQVMYGVRFSMCSLAGWVETHRGSSKKQYLNIERLGDI